MSRHVLLIAQHCRDEAKARAEGAEDTLDREVMIRSRDCRSSDRAINNDRQASVSSAALHFGVWRACAVMVVANRARSERSYYVHSQHTRFRTGTPCPALPCNAAAGEHLHAHDK